MVLTNLDGRLDQSLYDRLRRHLTDEQIVEVAMVSGILSGAAKMGFTLGLRDREAVCDIRKAPQAIAA